MPSDPLSPEESLAALIEGLELDGEDADSDAGVQATAELVARLRGNGAPLTLSAGLEERLAGLAGDAPAAVWTLFEPDTVAQCHALSVASGADVVVANTLEPLDALVSDEGVDPEGLLVTGALLAAHAAAPFSLGAVRLGTEDPACLGRLSSEAACLGINRVLLAGVATPKDAARAVAALTPGLPVVLLPDTDGWEAAPDPGAWRVSGDVVALGVEAPLSEALGITERDAPSVRDAGLGWVVRGDVAAVAPEQCAVALRRLYDAGATAAGLSGPVTPAHSLALRDACDAS